MEKISNDELKKIQCDILLEIHEFCESKGIKYFLAYGSLLGAVRHKGYIPWDNDIDIALTRPEYTRFAKEFNDFKFKMPLRFVDYSVDHSFPYSIGKVVLENSKIDELDNVFDYKLGINIDVYPVDGISGEDSSVYKKEKFYKLLLAFKRIKKGNNFFRNICLQIGKFFLLPVSNERLVRKKYEIASNCDYNNSKYGCVLVQTNSNDKPISIECFNDVTPVEYEGHLVNAPIGYDVWLKSIFGDYMQLPPEDKRNAHLVNAYIDR